MQEDKEQLLQQLLDLDSNLKQVSFVDAQEDFDAYKVLYSALKQETSEGLSFGFKAEVLRQIKLEKKRTGDLILSLSICIVVLIGIMVITFITLSYSDVLVRYLDIIIKVGGLICLTVVSLIIFHLVEEKYLPLQE